MAETTETADIGVSDSELFSGALAPEPAAPPPPPHPADDRRDALGRFRPQSDPPPAEVPPPVVSPPVAATAPGLAPASPGAVPPPPPPPDDTASTVPSWRLREEREQREALTRQLQDRDATLRDMQRRMDSFERQQAPATPQEIPDPLIDPAGYRSALEGKFASDLGAIRLENNLQLNRLQHGEVFDSAYQAFMQAGQSDPGFARLIVNSPNPGGAMVSWYKRAVTLARVGDDPDAFINSEIERRMADPKFLATAMERARAVASGQPVGQPQAIAPNNVMQIPPSLSRIPSGSPTEIAVDNSMPSDGELFRSSLPPPRRKA